MPRTITCTPGILRATPDAFRGTSVRRQRGAGEAEEPDGEDHHGEADGHDHHLVEYAAAAGGGALAAHRAQPGRRVARVVDAAGEPAVRAVELAQQLADDRHPDR